jgi:hypothetical protein
MVAVVAVVVGGGGGGGGGDRNVVGLFGRWKLEEGG